MAEYFSMGGHGGFIWSAWGIAIAVLSVLVVASIRSMRARERELARMESEAPRRRRRAGAGQPAAPGTRPDAATDTGENP